MNRRVTIASAVGLHARPAAMFAKTAAGQSSPVTIAKVVDGQPGGAVDATSVLALMGLGAMHGDEVELAGDDESALAELAELLSSDHDAEPA